MEHKIIAQTSTTHVGINAQMGQDLWRSCFLQKRNSNDTNADEHTGHAERALTTVGSALCAGAMPTRSAYRVASRRAQMTDAAISPSGGHMRLRPPAGHDSDSPVIDRSMPLSAWSRFTTRATSNSSPSACGIDTLALSRPYEHSTVLLLECICGVCSPTRNTVNKESIPFVVE